MISASAMMVTLFLGGWTLPFFGLDQPAQSLGVGLLHILIFLAKLCGFLVLIIWVRWMLPRFRYDQLMTLGWKVLLPLAIANLLLTGAVVSWS